MKVIATLSLTTLVALAAALPQPTPESTNDITEVDIGPIPAPPPGIEDGAPTVLFGDPDAEPADKRDGLAKRAFNIQVWSDAKRGGRHQALSSDVQKCYNLGNHWPNSISSLYVPAGHGCQFFNKNNCPQGGARITVGGNVYIPDLKGWHFNDKINSYICYNNEG